MGASPPQKVACSELAGNLCQAVPPGDATRAEAAGAGLPSERLPPRRGEVLQDEETCQPKPQAASLKLSGWLTASGHRPLILIYRSLGLHHPTSQKRTTLRASSSKPLAPWLQGLLRAL